MGQNEKGTRLTEPWNVESLWGKHGNVEGLKETRAFFWGVHVFGLRRVFQVVNQLQSIFMIHSVLLTLLLFFVDMCEDCCA